MRQRRLSIPCVESLSAAETDERTMQSIPSQPSMFLSKRISHKLRHHGGHRCSNWSTAAIRVLRYYTTRADGKRVEHMVAIGLVKNIGPRKADASREADRQKLRETINQLKPFQGQPRTFGQLCQHYIQNELRIDQTNSARPKEFPTIETYE
jgi:hypothetical protein